ncbi:MAG TPA: exodeoxyribonuclease VII large subunit [Gallionellaceae bacterium]
MSSELNLNEKNRVFSVRELNFAAKQLIESGLPLMWVRGEISNFVSAASGHWYFSLKDEQAQVRCAMFRNKSQYLDWKPANGKQVEVLALPTLYEARGDFQLILEQMRPAGLGALHEAFERLKQKLEAEGLFARERKRPLPALPAQIGIVTSPQAAALRDVLTTLGRRMPGISVVLYPTPVQGEGAGQKIAQAIKLANERAECDVLIVCRGGGSLEDLWAFNEEPVARAIAGSHIPVVSGVGHETDFTIADFAADQRAATPTAAAQLATPDREELMLRLRNLVRHLARAHQRRLETAMQQLDYLQRRLVHPAQKMAQQAQHLGHLQSRLRMARPDVERLIQRQEDLARRLGAAMQRKLENGAHRLNAMQQHLTHLDPDRVLARGYSMVRDAEGRIVADSARVKPGALLEVTFAKGWARAEVKEKG